MNRFRRTVTATVLGAMSLMATPASAQLPGGVLQNAAKAQAEAQAKQQIKNQTQQQVRAQAEAQARVQIQTQLRSRIQAEATRAARIAQQVTINTQQRVTAATRSQAAEARKRAGAGLNVSVATRSRVRTQGTPASSTARLNADARAELGIESGLLLPPNFSQTDVEIYDNIFGQFNPLRSHARQEPPASSEPAGDSDTAGDEERRNNRQTKVGQLVGLQGETSFAVRTTVAARQRRAEISEIRDRALLTADTQLMAQAQRMEDSLNAFADAQIKLERESRLRANRSEIGTTASGSARSTTRIGAEPAEVQ